MNSVVDLLGQYGYLIVFFGVAAESMGVPLPGETILIAAGLLAQQGGLDVGDAILFGILGAVVGDQIGYWAGRKGGRPFVLRWGRYVKITPERLVRAEAFFARHGGKAVFLARFFSGLRVFGALVAGTSRMRWGTFLFYNALGGAVWATAAVLVGYLLGNSLGLVERWAGRASLLLAIVAGIVAVLYLAYRWAISHPQKVQVLFDRLGGRRIQAALESPAGLWMRRRLSPTEVYGLSLSTGLVLTGLFSWAFGGIVQDVVARDPLVRIDLAVVRFLNAHSEPALTTAVAGMEAILSPEVLLPTGALAGLTLIILARKYSVFNAGFSGMVLLASSFGTGALAELFKLLFYRPRPPASLQLVHATGNSFPSAHAMTAVALGAALWYLLALRPQGRWGGSWRAKSRMGVVILLVVLLGGLGQVYTGAHYPSDVLAGWALGGLWASICLTAAEVFRRLRLENGEYRPYGIWKWG